jgi:hypoxanthine-guanine phosphoribosyltransferase
MTNTHVAFYFYNIMTTLRFLQNCVLFITNTNEVDGKMVVSTEEKRIEVGKILQVEDIIDQGETISLVFPNGLCQNISKNIIESIGIPPTVPSRPCCSNRS